MNDPTRYRARVVEVQAIRWLGIENCEQVFAFLGLEHDDDQHHDLININSYGSWQTVETGDWIVRYSNGNYQAFSDDELREEFEPADEPETFTWGESIGTDHDNICIPVNRGDTWIGDIKMPVKAAWELSDMLVDLLDDVAREQQSGRERCCD